MTVSERATGEWLSRELTGLKGDALFARLAELAPQVTLSVERATAIFRRYRYEEHFAARHCEVNRKYGVEESTYDPGALERLIDDGTFQPSGESRQAEPEMPGASGESKALQLAGAAAALLDYLQPGVLKLRANFKFWRW